MVLFRKLPFLNIPLTKLFPESDPSEETLSRTTSSKGTENLIPTIISPPLPADLPLPKPSHHKKTGRPPARRGRVGRNQYTKDRDPRPLDPTQPDTKTSPLRSESHPRDTDDKVHHPNYSSNSGAIGNPNSGNNNSNNWANGNNQHHENLKPFKSRRLSPKCSTMNDMKRRVSNILEFISRTQIEMARTSPSGGEESTTVSRPRTRTHSSATIMVVPAPSPALVDGNKNISDRSINTSGERLELEAGLNLDTFKSLNSVEMMEILTRGLMKWQGDYGNADGK